MLESMNDELIGKNIAARRGEISQNELANSMRSRGYAWQQKTVSLIEKGERSIRLNEAADIAEILQIDIADLLKEPDIQRTEMDLDIIRASARCEASANVLATYLEKYLDDYQELRFGVSLALSAGYESKALQGGRASLETLSLWNILVSVTAHLGNILFENPEEHVEELTGLKKSADSTAYEPYKIDNSSDEQKNERTSAVDKSDTADGND